MIILQLIGYILLFIAISLLFYRQYQNKDYWISEDMVKRKINKINETN